LLVDSSDELKSASLYGLAGALIFVISASFVLLSRSQQINLLDRNKA